MFVFVYKGKNFYRGGKRERGWCGVAAEGGIVVASFSLICVGRMWERDFWVCGGGGWFLGGSWLRFGEEWSRNEKVFARSVRVFWAGVRRVLAAGECLLPRLSLPVKGCSVVG